MENEKNEKEIIEGKDVSFEKTKEALGLLGLNSADIDTFFKITGRGTVTKGEICILQDITFEEADDIVNNLLLKGLLREIPGKTPHYLALPPYSALLSQLSQFKSLISNIQENTPKDLENRFKTFENQVMKVKKLEDYQKYLVKLRNELPQNINNQLNSLQSSLNQVKELQEFNEYMNKLKGEVSTELNNEFILFKDRLEGIKTKITSVFEKQFRISALKSFAEKIVTQIISEEFGFIQEFFEEKFVNKIQNTLDQILERILSVSTTAGEISSTVGGTFEEITKNLEDTLKETEFKLSEVQNDILNTFNELKKVFKDEIFETIQSDILREIFEKLELSEKTMQEFWDRAKQASFLSFQDVWFIMSEEAMKAQINDSLSRAKMRVHIISPKLQDIDIISLKNVPKHVNIRISALVDQSTDKELFEEITSLGNVIIRNYSRQNIWAINRDFEEVVVCVLSHTESNTFEIAGMGSILEEHIKMFAGVLEGVWMESEKIMHKIDREVGEGTKKEPLEIKPILKMESAPVSTKKIKTKPIEASTEVRIKPKKEEYVSQKPISKPTSKQISKPILKPVQKSEQPKNVGSKKISLISLEDTSEFIIKNFDLIKSMIDTENGSDISEKLEEIRESLLEKIGFSLILHQISGWVKDLRKIKTPIPDSSKQELSKEITNWVNKLIAKK